jgi:hypothetical protein
VEQLDCLSSAARIQIFAAFRLLGPSPIARVAAMLGRPADSLYHHVRKMLRAGLLVETGSERVAKRDAALYDVVADYVFPKPRPWDEQYTSGLTGFRSAILKSTLGFSESSLLHPSTDMTINQVHHLALWLDPEKARELLRKLTELEEWILANQDPHEGLPFIMLGALLPISSS